MKKYKSKIFVSLVLLLLVGLSIGYAAISTNLNISGTAIVNKAGWSVYFDDVSVVNGSVTASLAPVASGTTTSLSYAVALVKPGDFYEFTVVVKNAGTLTAKLSGEPSLGGVNSEQDVYINYTVAYDDGTAVKDGDIIPAGSSKILNVKVLYDNNISADQLPTDAQTLNLTYAMTYVQG